MERSRAKTPIRLGLPSGSALLTIFVALTAAGVSEVAWAQQAQPATDSGSLLPLPERAFEFARTYQALFGGALGAAVGYLAKWFFDQWSAERTARREFAQSVTTQISDLAKDYYWSLANYAGVLAGLLESYLDNRTHHLMLLWADPKDLDRRLDEIAKNFAETSFYHFCRLIGLFDEFQFQHSNTYLLTSHAAGETSKRLYNTFIGSLSAEDPEDRINTLKIVKVLQEMRQTDLDPAPIPVSKFPNALFIDEVANKDLKTELEDYRNWIRNRVPEVEEAADALRAYNELLNHELARLYRDFFKKTPPDSNLYLGEVAFDDWPNLLTEQSYAAIERANLQSALLRPLGAPISARQPSAGEGQEDKRRGRDEHHPQREVPDTAEKSIAAIELAADAKLGRLLRHMVEQQGSSGSGESAPSGSPGGGDDTNG